MFGPSSTLIGCLLKENYNYNGTLVLAGSPIAIKENGELLDFGNPLEVEAFTKYIGMDMGLDLSNDDLTDWESNW